MHENSLLLFQRYAAQYFTRGKRVLEIGPEKGGSSYRKLVEDATPVWDTIDIDQANQGLTYISTDEYSFPISDNCYDIVLSGMFSNMSERFGCGFVRLPEYAKTVGSSLLRIQSVGLTTRRPMIVGASSRKGCGHCMGRRDFR